MTIKKFFKPTNGKIATFLFVFLVPYAYNQSLIRDGNILSIFYLDFFPLLHLFIRNYKYIIDSYQPVLFIISFVLILSYWYVLSCFIVRLIKKIKNKNASKRKKRTCDWNKL